MGRIRGGGKEWLRSQTTPYVAKREYTPKKKIFVKESANLSSGFHVYNFICNFLFTTMIEKEGWQARSVLKSTKMRG